MTNKPLAEFDVPNRSREGMTTRQVEELRALQAERMSRQIESVRLYQPQPWQEEFHRCTAKRRIVRGGVRSGKSLAAFIEDAWAVTGQDPFDKYPAENGTMVMIGFNWKHYKTVIVPKLFKAGAFLIIRDSVTGKWRAFDPRREDDVLRRKEAKPAPPLIPKRFIKKMHWINKGKGELDSVELTTGWQILCFSSEGQIPQGFDANRVHIDEDLARTDWVTEMESRLSTGTGINRAGEVIDGGILDWSAMPHDLNDALTNLCDRADSEAGKPDARVVKFSPRFDHNYHISEKERRETMKDWANAGNDVLRRRAFGESSTGSTLMYPGYSPNVHMMDIGDCENREDWCRYMVVDPGHTICAVLFAAVPPPHWCKAHSQKEFVLLEDELYIENCDAGKFAEEVEKKIGGHTFHAFIIDSHGGQLTDFGSGRSPREQYADELRKRHIRSELTGSDFFDGSDDIAGRCGEVRNFLKLQEDGKPKLRILRNGSSPMLPAWEFEIKRYVKQTKQTPNGRIVVDKPAQRGRVHLMQVTEMLCAFQPYYREPKKRTKRPTSPVLAKAAEKRKKKGNQRSSVLLGSFS